MGILRKIKGVVRKTARHPIRSLKKHPLRTLGAAAIGLAAAPAIATLDAQRRVYKTALKHPIKNIKNLVTKGPQKALRDFHKQVVGSYVKDAKDFIKSK